ncbi:hypothetical protein C9374_013745 [Naegleria lovaniensis]|uniref:Chorein N-terminal domain-containing protein n=1 Tax=Naegleria lovaniensis TaxID=51637 RepID=A0AA88GDI4_NAELO|nr:uncharacterized protein C9374_013745 [Naegleria lovaniensis]KAG2370910.1 hypothetical protein C9374_013745 [Naegleria lovaniensis]
MTDRLISNVLGKYLSVFIKNWGKDALSLSFLKGTGALTNLQVNEQVIQEVLPIDFLQVMDAHVNQLSIRLPGLTRLTNDPIVLTLDRLVINLEEPIKPFVKKTPLKDFLEKNRGSQGDDASKSSTGTSKYGFVDRIIDGIKIVVNWVEINVKTLGQIPSTTIGPYTPHVLQILVKGFSLQTTDYRFKPVTDLKLAIPKVEKNHPFVWVHRLGSVESISISLIPSLSFYPSNQKKPSTFVPLPPIRLLDDIYCQMFITMKKRAVTVGKQSSLLSVTAEIVLPRIAITLRQEDIKGLISVLLAFKAASAREDLKQPKDVLSTYVKKHKRSNSQTSLSSKTSMTTTNSGKQSKAISKFFVESKDNAEAAEDSDDEAKLEEELAELDSDLGDMEIINDETIKKANAQPQEAARKTIVVNLNEFQMTFLYSRDSNNQPKQVVGRENKRVLGYFFEMLGFQLGVVIPEDNPTETNVQLGIPFIQFKEITTSFKGQGNLTDNAASFLDLELLSNLNTVDNEMKDESYIIQPQIFREEYEEDEIISHTNRLNSPNQPHHHAYTVNLEIWPEFLSTHRYYPDHKIVERVYRPHNSILKRKFFEEGKEMVRFKFVKGEGMEFVLECRINPIQVMLDVRRIIRLVEYCLECLPDMSIKPPPETVILINKPIQPSQSASSLKSAKSSSDKLKISPSTGSLTSSDYTSDDDGDEKSFSFLVEIRSPKIYVPSNYSVNSFSDVNEIMCIDSRELIITSDPRIKKQSEWGKKDQDSLFAPKSIDSFPSCGTDYSSQHGTLWELLPHKFKVKLSDFLIQIMPSIHSPPQRIMEPLSLTFDLGVNDESISEYHAKLPKIVLLTFIENLNFHMNQSQVILLLEFIRTFVDDPPMIKSLLIQSTKSFHAHNIDLFKKSSQQPVIETPKEDIRLIPLMFMSKIASLELSITASSATSMEAFFSSKYDPSMDAKLLTLQLNGAEVLVETNNITKTSNFVTVKSKITHFEITSPQNGQNPSSIMVSHINSKTSQKSPYVFAMNPKKFSSNTPKYMVVFRYEHPVDLSPADTKVTTPTSKDDHSIEPHVNLKYLRNARLILRANGIHVGLNTDTAYHVFHFLNSRENAFDISPMEIMNRTVKRTYSKIREKYLPEKKKSGDSAASELSTSSLPADFLSPTEDTHPQVISSQDFQTPALYDQQDETPSEIPVVATTMDDVEKVDISVNAATPVTPENTEEHHEDDFEIITSCDVQEKKTSPLAHSPQITLTIDDDGFSLVDMVEKEEQAKKGMATITSKQNSSVTPATPIITTTNETVTATTDPSSSPHVERAIEPATILRKPKESTSEIIPVIKEEIIPVIKEELIPTIKTVAKKIKDKKNKPKIETENRSHHEGDEDDEDHPKDEAYLASTRKTFYPMLFDVSIEGLEVYIIGKGPAPNAAGFEIKTLGVVHVPTRAIMETEATPKFDNLYRIEHLDRSSKQTIQSFSNRSHEYELKLFGSETNVHCLIRTDLPFKSLDDINNNGTIRSPSLDENNLQVVPLTSAPVDFMLGLVNDYTKPLSKRGIWFQAMDPSIGHSKDSLRIEIKPEMLYVISKLLRSQFKDIKQWADMLQGYFALFADKRTLLIIKKFQTLGDLISESQRSFTKTLVEHYNLTKLVANMQTELNDKTEALESAIQSKIHLTEILAEMQNQQSLIRTPSKSTLTATTTTQSSTPKVEDNKKQILIEGPCKVLTHSTQDFKRVHCVMLDTCEILCLTQKLPPNSFVKDSTASIDKVLFYHMPLKDTTEYIQTHVPVDDGMPKEVFALINGNEKRLFIYPETANQLKDWVRLGTRTIEELRLKNLRIDICVQTDISREFFEKKENDSSKHDEIINKVLTDETIEYQNRELRQMQKQFETIKDCLRLAAEEEFALRIEFSQLYEYIQSFRNEQEKREQSISTFLAQESETRKLLAEQKLHTKKLQSECDFRDHKIRDLENKLKEEKKRFKKAQEETNALHRTLREHILQLQQELQKTQIDKSKVEKEYNILVKRQIQQTERALKMEKKNETSQIVRGEISDQQLVNSELKNIISDLYVQLAELKEQNQILQMQNMELGMKLAEKESLLGSRTASDTTIGKDDSITTTNTDTSITASITATTPSDDLKLETVLSFRSQQRSQSVYSPIHHDDKKPLPHIPPKHLPQLPVAPPNSGNSGTSGMRSSSSSTSLSSSNPSNSSSTSSTSRLNTMRERGATFASALGNKLRDTFNK